MREVFEAMKCDMDESIPCVLVSAVGGTGSAPRKTRAHMLVDHRGRVCGTVGGGAVEGKSIELALQLLMSGESCVRTFVLEENSPYGLGMICGGSVTVHFCFVSPDDEHMQKLAERAVDCFVRGKKAWLLIRVHEHVLSLHGEGELPEALSGYECEPAFSAEDGTLYGEVLVASGRVYIFGGGHVAQALTPVLASVGFRCVIIEDRVQFCNPALFPQAVDVRLARLEEWEKVIPIMPEDYICIMTRGHKNDLECQAFALRTPASYIGVIGSRKKIAAVNARLLEMGFGEEDLSRIVTPIGLDIGAQTPAEIAVSIAAQLIAHRAGKKLRYM